MRGIEERLLDHLHETAVLRSTRSMLGWDQETYLPKGAAPLRAKQVASLAGLIHERDSSTELGDLLAEAADAAAPDSLLEANVREAQRTYELATRIPADLVQERARVATLARDHWAAARAERDFGRFLPWLEQIVSIAQRYADSLGYDDHPYDALVDLYEPGETTANLNRVFAPLRDAHTELVARIVDAGHPVDTSCLRQTFAVPRQRTLAEGVARAVGFDFDRGRVDLAVHPMCMGRGPLDVRITTRFAEDNFQDGFFSLLHEVGHGLYEQGLNGDDFGWPSGEACSLGIHESQSRMWENLVGRSLGFWRHFYPAAQEAFPDALGAVAVEDFWRAINEVRPSFIRVDADEVTYNLHVFLRFELEQAILTGDLAPKDIPDAWNERFEQSFRLRPPHDGEGCLQDVHWSAGLYGYFPTYTLGNVYAAQIFAKAQAELGDLEAQFAEGEFAPLREWLTSNIHRHGRRYPPRDLVEKVTGAAPSHDPLIGQLETKFARIYKL